MKFFKIIIHVTTLFTLTNCSSGTDASVSPHLNLKQISAQGCLNLQALAQITNGRFQFPSRRTTLDFSTSPSNTNIEVRNFGVIESTMTDFPYLRNPKQNDCSEVTLHTAYGRPLFYEITSSTNQSLKLSLRDEQSKAAEEAVREMHQSEIIPKQLHIEITSTTSAVIYIQSQIFDSACRSKVDYNKKVSFRWGYKLSDLPNSESLDAEYRQKYPDLLDDTENTVVEGIKSSHLEMLSRLENHPC